MATVKNNTLTEGLSGRIGNQLVFRHLRDGRTVVVSRPDFSDRVFSTEQLTHQSRFQQAAAYAKVGANPKTRPSSTQSRGRVVAFGSTQLIMCRW